MSIYNVISERFKSLDNLLENGYLEAEEHFDYCTKLTDVLLELARHGAEVSSYDLEPEIRLVSTEELNGD